VGPRTAVKASWGRDPLIVRWTEVPANNTEEAALARAARAEELRKAGRAVALAIVDANSGKVLGSCDIRRPDPDDAALGDVGFLLAEGARGRGLASRAVGLLVDWSFRELGMERVQGLVHPENPRPAEVLQRLGFRREGLLRDYRAAKSGREDRILFSVLPDELVLVATPIGR
jgi:ribosomal-protein-alanine N-acetyltransferase